MRRVATYSAEGRRIRDYSLDALLRLYALRKVYFSFTARGRLLNATFLPHDGSKLLKTAHMGQYYSFAGRVGDSGGRVWEFASFLNPRNVPGLAEATVRDRELFLLTIFRAVPLSIMRRDPDPPASPKVVSIASGRRRSRAVAGLPTRRAA